MGQTALVMLSLLSGRMFQTNLTPSFSSALFKFMDLQNVWKIKGRALVQQIPCDIGSHWNILQKYHGNNWLFRMVGYQYFIDHLQKNREDDFQLPFLQKKLSHLTLSICKVNTIPKIFVPIYQEQNLQKLFLQSIQRFTNIRKWRENVGLKSLLIMFIMQHALMDFLIILLIRSMVYKQILDSENQFQENPQLNKVRFYGLEPQSELIPFIATATQTKLSFYSKKEDESLKVYESKQIKNYQKELHIMKEMNNYYLMTYKKTFASSYEEIKKKIGRSEKLVFSEFNQVNNAGQLQKRQNLLYKRFQSTSNKIESIQTIQTNIGKANPMYFPLFPKIRFDQKVEERLYENENMVPSKKNKMSKNLQIERKFLKGFKQPCDFCGLKFESRNNAIFCGAQCQYRYYLKDKHKNNKNRNLLLEMIKYRK